jgi:D-alanyl-lipoteichoic acid acyltransferase DltB (MBOAT superfamily)
MLFNSFQFAVFLPTVVALYWALSHRWQNRMLLVASYVFYGAWDWRFLGLILLSTIVDYNAGLRIGELPQGKAPDADPRRRFWVGVSVGVNLAILGFFKYFNFFIGSLTGLLEPLGLAPSDPLVLKIVLPVGISFYTFQTISYSIDIYRGYLKPARSFLDFALFVSFFPQLVAGPIERANVLLPQILNKRVFSKDQFVDGLGMIFWGLFMKIFIADNLAPIVNQQFAAQDPTGFGVLMGLYAFSLQIYGDFAGYSKIARGCARLMGFELLVNFRFPFISSNPSEFWQRWHISLSTWLRDYLFYPLGGARGSRVSTLRNVAVTMLLGGLWHGATWLFVLWGAFQGVLLVGHRVLAGWLKQLGVLQDKRKGTVLGVARILVTFHLVCLGWLLFRGQSVGQVLVMLQALLTMRGAVDPSLALTILGVAAPLVLIEGAQILAGKEEIFRTKVVPLPVKSAVFAVLTYLLVFHGASAQSFIYFQF